MKLTKSTNLFELTDGQVIGLTIGDKKIGDSIVNNILKERWSRQHKDGNKDDSALRRELITVYSILKDLGYLEEVEAKL